MKSIYPHSDPDELRILGKVFFNMLIRNIL